MSICTCSGKNLTIPVEGLTECSLCGWTIYGFAFWIYWAYLSQVQGYNAITTTCEWEVLLVSTFYIIRYAIPYIRCIAELSVELRCYILALWDVAFAIVITQVQSIGNYTTVESFIVEVLTLFGVFLTTPYIYIALADCNVISWHYCAFISYNLEVQTISYYAALKSIVIIMIIFGSIFFTTPYIGFTFANCFFLKWHNLAVILHYT